VTGATPLSSPAEGVSATDPVHPQRPTPESPPPKKGRSELPKRLLSSAILVPSVIFVIVQGGLWTLGTVIAVILLGQREMYRLIQDKGAHPLVGFGLAAGAALPVVAYLGNEYHATVLMTATLLATMVLQLGKTQIAEALESISGTFFGVFYVGWLLSHAVVLRQFDGAVASKYGAGAVAELGIGPGTGIFLLILTLTIVVWCDAGAYFAGRAYGKRKLAPTVSPGKTVEGAAGGVLAGVAGGLAAKGVFDLFWPELSHFLGWTAVLVLGFPIAVVAILGDLVESLLKRDAHVKDAGSLLPGMGGVLDRIDSPLLGIPVMYYLLLFYVYLLVGRP
jgi:phosphatidate cytidylyltransferase